MSDNEQENLPYLSVDVPAPSPRVNPRMVPLAIPDHHPLGIGIHIPAPGFHKFVVNAPSPEVWGDPGKVVEYK